MNSNIIEAYLHAQNQQDCLKNEDVTPLVIRGKGVMKWGITARAKYCRKYV